MTDIEPIREQMQGQFNKTIDEMNASTAKNILDRAIAGDNLKSHQIAGLSLVSAWMKKAAAPHNIYGGAWTQPEGKFISTAGNYFYTKISLIITRRDDKTVVFMYERSDNSGQSVTNAILNQDLIPSLMRCFNLNPDPDKTAFVEIYNNESYGAFRRPLEGESIDTKDRVRFQITDGVYSYQWERLDMYQYNAHLEVSDAVFAPPLRRKDK